MHRRFGPVPGLLLGGILVVLTTALRSSEGPGILLQEARPNPILPAALIPFSIGQEVCKEGHVPHVTLTVLDAAINVVATLPLRGKNQTPLDDLPLRCGDYVAIWDGTVDNGRRVAVWGNYYIFLTVDRLPRRSKLLRVPQY